MPVRLTGLGASVPQQKVTNDWFSSTLETSDEWITSRTGIKTRFHAGEGEYTSHLACNAGRAALESRGETRRTAIDTLILATTTPDRSCPASAPGVAARLGLGTITAFDINAVCSGFIYGLEIAEALLRSRKAQCVMLIGADVFSTILDKNDRSTWPLFGDGAGAIILEYSESEENLIITRSGSDGEFTDLITVPDGGTESKLRAGNKDTPVQCFFTMHGKEVFFKAVSKMGEMIEKVLSESGLSIQEIDYLVPHQANLRIIDTLVRQFDMNKEQALVSLDEFGNTSAASIPITLAKFAQNRTIKGGDKIVLAAFGGGLTWGAGILQWPEEEIKVSFL